MGVGRTAVFEVVIVSCVGLTDIIPLFDPLVKGTVAGFVDVGFIPLVKLKVGGDVVDSCMDVIDVDVFDVASGPFIETAIVPFNVVVERCVVSKVVVATASSLDVPKGEVVSFDGETIDDKAADGAIDSSKEDEWAPAIFDVIADSFAARSADGVVAATVETSMATVDSGFVV